MTEWWLPDLRFFQIRYHMTRQEPAVQDRPAESDLYRWERQRAGRTAPQAPFVSQFRRAMLDAHPDRGGTAEQFIQARRRYQTALQQARIT